MKRYTWRTGLREGTMILVTLLFAAPVYILINVSFGQASGQTSPISPTTHPTFANYATAWQQGGLGSALLTSIVVTVCSVFLIVVVAAFAAFPLARSTARWSRGTFYFIMAGLVLPFLIALIPLYQTMRTIHLLGSPVALVIIYAGAQFPLSVFLYVGFLRRLPRDFEEAAMIDGCGPARAFVSVVLPMVRPVTGTVAILNAVFVWNDFLGPLLFLGTGTYQTLPVAVYGFVGEYTAQWPLIFAGVTVAVLPILVVYFAMQRRVLRGFSSGLKG